MSVKSREKIALFVFLGLIVLSLCGLGWYLVAGHSWNVAASNLDDTFGSMDGYTAIVYPGTAIEPQTEKEAGGAADAGGTAGASGAAAGGTGSQGGAAAGGEKPGGAAGGSGSGEAEGRAGGAAAGGEAGAASKDAAGDSDEGGATASNAASGGSLAPKKTLSAQEAKEGYEDKGATVFPLDTADLDAYREGVILRKGGHRFGVFSISAPTSSILLEKQIAYFKRHQVDFIVLVTPDKEYAEGVAGIDIVVSTQDEGLFVMGETIDGTFYVDAPSVGSVGAILISPSNVVSAKVLQAS